MENECKSCVYDDPEDLTTTKTLDLNLFTTDNLIDWRNEASIRVNDRDKTTDAFVNEVERLSRENIKDLRWIARLNRKIDKRAFGYKTQIYRNQ